MVTSKGAFASRLATESPPKPAPMITTRGSPGRLVVMSWPLPDSAFNADDDLRVLDQPEAGGEIEFRGEAVCRFGGARHRLPLGQRPQEGMTAGRKAADFHCEERPRHQGGLSHPPFDRAVGAAGPVHLPGGHDREARF